MEIGTMKLTTSTSSKENFTFSIGEQGIPKCTPDGEGEVGSKKFTMDANGNQTNLGFHPSQHPCITSTTSTTCEIHMAKAISKCGIHFNKKCKISDTLS